MHASLSFAEGFGLEGLRVGLVEARGLDWSATPAGGRFASLLEEAKAEGEALIPPSRKTAVRSMLRYGAYKPAGRAKPSSEYLLQALLESDFPAVNPFVDAANIVSLLSGYPISILDLDKSGVRLLLRRGKAGENYVFNAGGQTIDLADLLCVCRQAGEDFLPTANPVRDSMATKIFPGAQNVAAVLYAPAGAEGRDLESACAKLVAYLGESAESAEWTIVEAKR